MSDGWKQYPENNPTPGIAYLVQTDLGKTVVSDAGPHDNWLDSLCGRVVAFRSLPEKYEAKKKCLCSKCGVELDMGRNYWRTGDDYRCANTGECRDRCAAQLASATARNEAVERVVEAAKKWRELYRMTGGEYDSDISVRLELRKAIDALSATGQERGA